MNLRFHNLSTNTGTPVIVCIMLYSLVSMYVLICGAQFVTTLDAQLSFPIQCFFVRGVGYDLSDSGTGSARRPVTGFIGFIDILMGNLDLPLITATVTELITIRGVVVAQRIGFQAAAGTVFPVLGFIGNILSDRIVTGSQGVTASITGV